MKLSIITICYNDKKGFEKTAHSVITQTWKDFEWIIVDGKSIDGSVDAIKDAETKIISLSSQIELHWKSEADKGIYNAMNKGIRQAHGEYCLFLNSGDVLYENTTLEKSIPYLKDGNIYVGDQYESTNLEHSCQSKPHTPEGHLFKMVFESYAHQSTFFKTTLFKKYGEYREDMRIASDWCYYYNLIVLNGEKVEYIPEIISIFDKTGISSKNAKEGHIEREQKVEEQPVIHAMYNFYKDNYLVVTALRSCKLIYNIIYWGARVHHKIFKNKYKIK